MFIIVVFQISEYEDCKCVCYIFALLCAFEQHLSFNLQEAQSLLQSCCVQIRKKLDFRPVLSGNVTQHLIHSFASSQWDFCSSLCTRLREAASTVRMKHGSRTPHQQSSELLQLHPHYRGKCKISMNYFKIPNLYTWTSRSFNSLDSINCTF